MIAFVDNKRNEILELCKRFRVKRLDLFGSAARGDFMPGKSDLDFVVEYLPLNRGEHADCYFDLLFALEDLFGCSIDLVMSDAIHNRFFLQGVNQCREQLYAA